MADAAAKPKQVRLSTTPSKEDLAGLKLGDIVYLDGLIYTAREGVYKRALQDGDALPIDLPGESATNFHCSPAATVHEDGSYKLGALTGTASFRFSKWMEDWFKLTGTRIVIGKGGMSGEDYREKFAPHGAIYLTTVGYGTGALLGRGAKSLKGIYWREELGLAQAIWLVEAENMGPFIVESDLAGNSLFERENARIAENLAKAYEGTRPPTMKRYGETDKRSDEIIG